MGVVLGILSVGLSAYSAVQQGKNADNLAQYNSAEQLRSAQTQLAQGRIQSELQRRIAEANAALATADAGQYAAAAAKGEADSRVRDKIAQENIRRQRMASEAEAAKAKSGIASSGAVESAGTPLDFLAEMAREGQLTREEMLWERETTRRGELYDAAQNRWVGRVKQASAGTDKGIAFAGAAMTRAASMASAAGMRRESILTRWAGKNAKREGVMSAVGSVIGGASGAYGKFAQSSGASYAGTGWN